MQRAPYTADVVIHGDRGGGAYGGALTAADAVADGLGAQLEYLAVDALGFKLLGDFGERASGVAVCLGAAIDQKNLHHKLPLLLVTSAEDYRTMGEAVRAWC